MSSMMMRWMFGVLMILPAVGCSSQPAIDSDGVVLFIPGVAGDGPWYDGLKRGLRDGGVDLPVESFRWGAPSPLFFLNFNNESIHEGAERALAERIQAIAAAEPGAPIILLTHSAGGGVALGALGKLDEGLRVDDVVLLHPSVSPGYDLAASVTRIEGRLTVFHSDRDVTFLSWRTRNFGTYDNIKTEAAGHGGFDLSQLEPALRGKVTQLSYELDFKSLGHDGDHFGPVARRFVSEQVAPMIRPKPQEKK